MSHYGPTGAAACAISINQVNLARQALRERGIFDSDLVGLTPHQIVSLSPTGDPTLRVLSTGPTGAAELHAVPDGPRGTAEILDFPAGHSAGPGPGPTTPSSGPTGRAPIDATPAGPSANDNASRTDKPGEGRMAHRSEEFDAKFANCVYPTLYDFLEAAITHARQRSTAQTTDPTDAKGQAANDDVPSPIEPSNLSTSPDRAAAANSPNTPQTGAARRTRPGGLTAAEIALLDSQLPDIGGAIRGKPAPRTEMAGARHPGQRTDSHAQTLGRDARKHRSPAGSRRRPALARTGDGHRTGA
jgi:hypothetical protein